ncbi:MAG: twin-arginine translocase TatA/TatE family subunit [Calditerrivibrio sp.]|nr:twin-arginine translocase TatA/TatE family subunit [Calditerrivibrio sp.]
MFGLGLSEILLIAVVAIVVIGPKRLPEVAKALGKGYAEFRRAMDGFKEAVKIDDVLEDKPKEKDLKTVYEEKWKQTSEESNSSSQKNTQEKKVDQ